MPRWPRPRSGSSPEGSEPPEAASAAARRGVKEVERALRKQGCPDCGSRKTVVRQRGEIPDVSLVHAAACPRAPDPFGGDGIAAAAARAVSLRCMASDGGGGGIVQDSPARPA
jgi:hypothetical protein